MPDPREVAAAMPDCRPTIWGAVPRIWEKLKAGLEAAVDTDPDENARAGVRAAIDAGCGR